MITPEMIEQVTKAYCKAKGFDPDEMTDTTATAYQWVASEVPAWMLFRDKVADVIATLGETHVVVERGEQAEARADGVRPVEECDGDLGHEETYLRNLLDDDRLTAEDLRRSMSRIRYRRISRGCMVTPVMVNAAWNAAKDRRMTGLPTDYRAILEAALETTPTEKGGEG